MLRRGGESERDVENEGLGVDCPAPGQLTRALLKLRHGKSVDLPDRLIGWFESPQVTMTRMTPGDPGRIREGLGARAVDIEVRGIRSVADQAPYRSIW